MNQYFLSSQFQFLLSHLWKQELWFALIALIFIRCIWVGKRNKQFICWPVLGMFPSFALVSETCIHDVITDILRNNNGTFTLKGPWFCNYDLVFTSDPCNFEYTLKTNFTNFQKGQPTRAVTYDLLGEGYFSVDGDEWIWLRKVASVKFRLAGFQKLVTETWVELIQSRLLPIVDDFVKQSVAFDLQDVLSRLSFDQSCVMAFGVNPGSFDKDLPVVPFEKAFKHAQDVTASRFYLPVLIWKIFRYLNLGSERNMRKSIQQVNEFVREAITSTKMELSGNNTNPRFDALSLLMESKDGDESSNPANFLRDICLNLVFAGSDTVSVSLSWFFWLLHKNPVVEEKVFSEISSILRKTAIVEGDDGIVYIAKELKKMTYLHAALTESLRLYPAVPINLREVQKDDQLPNCLKLEKGVKLISCMYAMGRMEKVWGKDCREFKPERWLKDGIFVTQSQYKFPAFNAGIRNCLGKDMAYYQMKMVAASIIHRYRVHVVENHPVVPKLSTVLLMKYGLKVTLTRRSYESDP
ncbi:hypothetical protein ACHQM5_026592 [Ranunculus cassubicifolius]